MLLPLSFRVVEMRANENRHVVTLVEQRRPMLHLAGQPSVPSGPQSPPISLDLDVHPDQFRQLSVGQVFELEPAKTAEAAGTGSLGAYHR